MYSIKSDKNIGFNFNSALFPAAIIAIIVRSLKYFDLQYHCLYRICNILNSSFSVRLANWQYSCTLVSISLTL